MRILLPFAGVLLVPMPASAAEIFAGLHAQGVATPLSLEADQEGGAAVSLGVRSKRLFGTPVQAYAFGSVSGGGDTNFLAAGISARFGRKFYIRPGVGIAVHDGSASNFLEPDRLAFGSRVLLEPELAVGAELSERLSLEASWVHFSHGQVFGTQNPGIDNIGLRLNWRL